MKKALIGYTGFVGSSLADQTEFNSYYRSLNISEIDNEEFDIVVCAGAPGQKWKANKFPEVDLESINNLISHIGTVKCRKFVLISTVDVFHEPINVYEDSEIADNSLNHYGKNRLLLESFVKQHFGDYLIVRLPGLVGRNLKKNIVYDFFHSNNLDAIDSRNVFQFYPMSNLWADIQVAIEKNIEIVHLTSEPISVFEVASRAFSLEFNNHINTFRPISYDFKSKYISSYNKIGEYLYSKDDVIKEIHAYIAHEQEKS